MKYLFKYPRLVSVLVVSTIVSLLTYFLASIFYTKSILVSAAFSIVIFLISVIFTITYKVLRVKNRIKQIRKHYSTKDVFPSVAVQEDWVSGIGFTGQLKHRQSALYSSKGVYVHYGAQLRQGSIFLPWNKVEGGYDIAHLSEGSYCFAARYEELPFIIAIPYEKRVERFIPNFLFKNP